jgi:hypothetical protein
MLYRLSYASNGGCAYPHKHPYSPRTLMHGNF